MLVLNESALLLQLYCYSRKMAHSRGNTIAKTMKWLTVGAKANHSPKLSWYPSDNSFSHLITAGWLQLQLKTRLACRETDSGGEPQPSGTFSFTAAQGTRGPPYATSSLNGDKPPESLSDSDLDTAGREQSYRGDVSLSRYCPIRTGVAEHCHYGSHVSCRCLPLLTADGLQYQASCRSRTALRRVIGCKEWLLQNFALS